MVPVPTLWCVATVVVRALLLLAQVDGGPACGFMTGMQHPASPQAGAPASAPPAAVAGGGGSGGANAAFAAPGASLAQAARSSTDALQAQAPTQVGGVGLCCCERCASCWVRLCSQPAIAAQLQQPQQGGGIATTLLVLVEIKLSHTVCCLCQLGLDIPDGCTQLCEWQHCLLSVAPCMLYCSSTWRCECTAVLCVICVDPGHGQ